MENIIFVLLYFEIKSYLLDLFKGETIQFPKQFVILSIFFISRFYTGKKYLFLLLILLDFEI